MRGVGQYKKCYSCKTIYDAVDVEANFFRISKSQLSMYCKVDGCKQSYHRACYEKVMVKRKLLQSKADIARVMCREWIKTGVLPKWS